MVRGLLRGRVGLDTTLGCEDGTADIDLGIPRRSLGPCLESERDEFIRDGLRWRCGGADVE